ncbi:hypothetical protein [Streptomyces mesophilus]
MPDGYVQFLVTALEQFLVTVLEQFLVTALESVICRRARSP